MNILMWRVVEYFKKKVAMKNFLHIYPPAYVHAFPKWIFIGVEFLDVCTSSVLADCLLTWMYQFLFPPAVNESFCCSTFSPAFDCVTDFLTLLIWGVCNNISLSL